MARLYAALICTLIIVGSCKKDTSTSSGTVKFSLSYKIDNQALVFESVSYFNQAGEQYSVDRLNYYLSNFRFYKNNIKLFQSDSIFYIDAGDTNTSHGNIKIPAGTYDSVAFCIGMDSTHNAQGCMPSTMANNAMIWPETMGGGYHFIRLEGHWKDAVNTLGYTVHLGSNGFQVKAGVRCALNIQGNQTSALVMTMNINEWFRGPHTYSFDKDGVYSMGIDSLMRKLCDNGADVFTAN